MMWLRITSLLLYHNHTIGRSVFSPFPTPPEFEDPQVFHKISLVVSKLLCAPHHQFFKKRQYMKPHDNPFGSTTHTLLFLNSFRPHDSDSRYVTQQPPHPSERQNCAWLPSGRALRMYACVEKCWKKVLDISNIRVPTREQSVFLPGKYTVVKPFRSRQAPHIRSDLRNKSSPK